MKNGASLCWSMSHTDYAEDTDGSLTRLCCLRFKRTLIFQMPRIALWAWLLEEKTVAGDKLKTTGAMDSSEEKGG